MSIDANLDSSSRIEEVIGEVSRWPGIAVADHRYGGREFRLGAREVGHVHYTGIVDIAFPKLVHDALVDAGWTEPHHVVPHSTWTTFRVRSDADVERALHLLRLSYLYHALSRIDTPEGAAALEAVDFDAELDRIAPPKAVRGRFAALRERAGY
ncbi:luciferase domain-containing protein [Halomarina pelagica]|uniref:luciferase domain-containing protein n=1 Tax=Halomarina pelagica TaxID=2961599 RepID=UPI0020C1FC33|nr:luciferase family protein [Halomarina sp. BND7]